MNTHISIGQVKRDISELVNRVTYAGERIILTSRGKPKAALISMDDYEQLLRGENRATDIQKWLAETGALSGKIENRRGQPVDVDAILAADRDDLGTALMDKMVVVDASVALKAILPNPLQAHCRALIKSFADTQPAAPALWAHETTSAISKTVHFGQITAAEGRQALAQLQSLGVQLFIPDAGQNLAAFDWTLRLKRAAAYDSYYLVLAQGLKCDFWTADGRLFNALKNEGLKWLRWIEEIPPLE